MAPSPQHRIPCKRHKTELTYCPIYGFKPPVFCTKGLTLAIFYARHPGSPTYPPSLARAHATARQPRAHPARIQPSGSREITAPRATCNSAATPGRPHHPGRRAHTDAHQARQQDSAPLATTAPCRFVFRRAHHACRSRLRTLSRTCPKQRMQFTTTSTQPTLSTDDNEAGRLRTYAHASHPEAISRAIKKPLKRGFFRLAE